MEMHQGFHRRGLNEGRAGIKDDDTHRHDSFKMSIVNLIRLKTYLLLLDSLTLVHYIIPQSSPRYTN